MGKRIKELKLKCPETHKREATKMPSRGEMSGQDWNTVAFGNKRPQSGAVGLKEDQSCGVAHRCRRNGQVRSRRNVDSSLAVHLPVLESALRSWRMRRMS